MSTKTILNSPKKGVFPLQLINDSNVLLKTLSVNKTVKKVSLNNYLKKKASIFAISLTSLCIPFASSAESIEQRAILNSQEVINMLHNVPAQNIDKALSLIEENKVSRLDSSLPVWIVEIISGSVVYFQGRPDLKGTIASGLIDSAGESYGDKALKIGRTSRGRWVNMNFDSSNVRAYCAPQYPFVACSVIAR